LKYDVIIIGAGIVGLATAHAILEARPGLHLAVVEKEPGPGRHQTGHNSGVLHSGIYYRPGSRKALTCRRGYTLMLRFLEQEGIDFDICGKLIVATDNAEVAGLGLLRDRGQANGLDGLRLLSAGESREIEPHVAACAALWVPQAGIVDYGRVAATLQNRVEQRGGIFLFNTRILSLVNGGVRTDTGEVVECTRLVNCAGLYSDRLAPAGKNLDHRIVPFRGEFYQLKSDRQNLVKGLVYPVPDPRFPFLGVHLTRRIDGSVEAGPNAVLALSREGYRWAQVNPRDLAETLAWPGFHRLVRRYWRTGYDEMRRSLSKRRFTQALQRLVPELDSADLVPGGAGVRAQALDRAGNLLDDFLIEKDGNAVHVYNAPSPGATASLAIGEFIADRIYS